MNKAFIINGQEISVQEFKRSTDIVSFVYKGKSYSYRLISKDHEEMVLDNGQRFRAAVGSPNRDGDSMIMAQESEAIGSVASKKMKKASAQAGSLTSPMPGKIFKIVKEVGTKVQKGETIIILEAMKMEHSIRSDKDGMVKKICFKTGELVQGGVILAEVE